MRNILERDFGGADLKVGQYIGRCVCVGAIFFVASVCAKTPQTSQSAKPKDVPIAVQFTDIRKSAGITFLQDSTAS